MKQFLFSVLILIALVSCQSNTQPKSVYLFSYFKDNGQDGLHLAYSRDGYHFQALNNDASILTPQVADDKLMRDPCIIQGPDKRFHMVWTVSWNDGGIGYASSEDLINWSEQKFVPVMQHEPTARNCWAPEIIYDDEQQQYMIYWATTIPGRFEAGEAQGDSEYNHRMYYTTTKDFVTFTPTELLYDEGFNVIDAVIKKINGEYFMFLKDETRYPPKKHIRIAKSTSLYGGYTLSSEAISPDWVEGPTVANVNDFWVLYYDEYTRHHMGAMRSADLVNWEVINDSISFPEGTRHGTVFKVKEAVLDNLLQAFKTE
ncbi:glycoside hydrolase family 43 protein [Draconibacterium sp. IB214405]|uniref:glycoside hydrolase family 43 protein n=1 Tax=Draconibacterium sp. IB214405 TaxID=3097352 RepID=UPI002A0D50D9|nr:glycoside hydrolase family 43 protein [Draconibacterium sp. IB214405]MDX8338267.1 glycoside hydrolase family 43 protein [Draconibacterium sp. IB214405]